MTAERRSSFPDDARKASASATPSAAKQHLEQKGREAAHDLKERASDLKDQAQSKLEEVRETASEKLHEARDYASEKLHEARDAAGDVVEEARDLASEKAAEAARKMREYGEQLASRQKLSLAEETRHLSLALRGAADRLHNDNDDAIASYADAAAEQLERASRYIRGHSVADLIDDAQEIVRERPGLVLGGMFIAGLAVGRFLNASASHRRDRGGASHFARNARFSATGSNGGRNWSGESSERSSQQRSASRDGGRSQESAASGSSRGSHQQSQSGQPSGSQNRSSVEPTRSRIV